MENFISRMFTKKISKIDCDKKFLYNCVQICRVSYYYPKTQQRYLIKNNFDNISIIRRDNAHITCCTQGNNVYIAFRGTEYNKISDIIDDIDILKKKEANLIIHAGAANHLDLVWNDILDYLNLHKDKSIIFTGHSLGGACGQIANLRIPKSKGIYFGSFCSIAHQELDINEKRIIHINRKYDIVPLLPLNFFGFISIGKTYIIWKKTVEEESKIQLFRKIIFPFILYLLIKHLYKPLIKKFNLKDTLLVNHKIENYSRDVKKIINYNY